MLGGRRKAREIVFRVLYETDVTGEDPLETLEYALARYRLTEDARDHAVRLLHAWGERKEEVDRIIAAKLAHWEMGRLSRVVRAILRLATAELLAVPETPARVILDEAIELALKYGEPGSDGFVNGVLDPIALAARPGEIPGGGDGE